jgi:hypothetical protein
MGQFDRECNHLVLEQASDDRHSLTTHLCLALVCGSTTANQQNRCKRAQKSGTDTRLLSRRQQARTGGWPPDASALHKLLLSWSSPGGLLLARTEIPGEEGMSEFFCASYTLPGRLHRWQSQSGRREAQ